jgi:hypothetical protein
MSDDKLRPLSSSIKSALDPAEWGRQRYLPGLTRRWPHLVGDLFAQHSLPAFFRREELWIYARHAIWIQQMQFAKPNILAKINTFLAQYAGPRVADLRWMLKPADFPKLPQEKAAAPPVTIDPESEQEFQELTDGVENEEARQALIRLWRHMETIRKQNG